MIKKTITYESYNGETITEDLYFNLTKLELLEEDIEQNGNFQENVERLTKENNVKEVYNIFKNIVLKAYGVKSEDGKRFIKNEGLRQDLQSSPALSELILSFLENPEEGAKFIEEILPSKLVEEAKKEQEKNKELTEKDPVNMTREELLEAMRNKNS